MHFLFRKSTARKKLRAKAHKGERRERMEAGRLVQTSEVNSTRLRNPEVLEALDRELAGAGRS